MSEVSPTRESSMEAEEDKEEQDTDRGSQRLVLPEDAYEWKKYGQKYIKNIGKFRSYFKCQRPNCLAKKRVEWWEPEHDLRIVYDGSHNHPSSKEDSSQGTSSSANQYNLYTQVFGDQPTSHKHQDN